MAFLSFIKHKIDNNFINYPDPLDKVRASFLLNTLAISLFVALFTLPGFWLKSFDLLFYRSMAIVIVQTVFIWIIIYLNRWKAVAHLLCIMVAIIIFTNFFVEVQGIKIISLQFIILLITISYYLLGKLWGLFYSVISAISIFLYFTAIGRIGIETIE
ncbi:MAG: hypothetical protein EOO47_12370, partial [Flavobacterium sp.]